MIKAFLAKYTPSLWASIQSIRFFSYCKKRYQGFQNSFADQLYETHSIKVITGPFTGMQYYNKIIWGPLTPKWVGSYEFQLIPVVQKIIESDYQVIVDIGAAEGYYAVGFAWRCSGCSVISYDIDPIARFRQKQLASLNEIQNLEIRKEFTHDKLAHLKEKKTCIVIDVEGYENIILDTSKASFFKGMDLLVETHSFQKKSIDETIENICNAFKGSHQIEKISTSTPNLTNLQRTNDILKKVSIETLEKAIQEDRTINQTWLWMTAK